jgi:hypothetical protein
MENAENKDQVENKEPEGDAGGDDSFDFMDCRPESKYPEANSDAVTPDYIKKMIAERKAGKPAEKEEGQAAESDEENCRPADQK